MERSVSIYGSSTVLRGIQLKIGEQFRPPAKVTLPVGWKTRDPSQILNLTYDFSLEEDILEKAKAEKIAKEQHEQAQKAQQQEAENELQRSTQPAAQVCMMGVDSILQPTSVMADGATSQNVEQDTFNYKDFENNTDTPFELVELQSINNMDALKSILDPVGVGASAGTSSGNSQIDIKTEKNTRKSSVVATANDEDGTNQLINITSPGRAEQTNPGQSPAVNIESRHDIYQQSSMNVGQVSVENSLPSNQNRESNSRLYNIDLNGFPIGQNVYRKSSVGAMSSYVAESSSTSAMQQQFIGDVQPPPLPQSSRQHHHPNLPGAMRVLPTGPAPQKPLPPRPQKPGLPPQPHTRKPGRHASSSEILAAESQSSNSTTTSIAGDGKRPIPKQRSKLPPINKDLETQSPPPIPPKQHKIGHQHAKRYPSPLPPISPPTTPKTTPNPLDSLSPSETEFANNLTVMGFPIQRVARAVKIFGCKEREVIEFLILFTEMCGQGYSEQQVEMVLKDSDADNEKAEKFLSLIAQFKELGFQEEKIFSALKESECDSNKTLDILTCG